MPRRHPYGKLLTSKPHSDKKDKGNHMSSTHSSALTHARTTDTAPPVAGISLGPAVVQETRPLYDMPPLARWVTKAMQPTTPVNEGVEQVRNDGITHINIGGRTDLGRMLSHFAMTPFQHPFYGSFNCMEGFWYYVRTDIDAITDPKARKNLDNLRTLVGWRAKVLGKEFPQLNLDNFRELIMGANYCRIMQNPELYRLFVNSTLPFDHYFLHGEGNILIRPSAVSWLISGLEDLRKAFKEMSSNNP